MTIYPETELQFSRSGKVLPHGKLRPYIVFNMVTSVDGRATTEASTPTDRQVMRQLRTSVDGVLWGGGTLRADPIALRIPAHLLREKPPLGIVWTRSGNLPLDHPFWQAGKMQRLVVCSQDTALDRQQTLATIAQVWCVETFVIMLERLWEEMQVKTLLVEGGPTLNALLLSQGIGDEFFVTLTPRLFGGKGTLTLLNGQTPLSIPLQLRSVLRHESELYLRYQLPTSV